MSALGGVRPRPRIAEDDGGAGYAGLRHILELRPDFAKLDLTLVRSLDADLACRASRPSARAPRSMSRWYARAARWSFPG